MAIHREGDIRHDTRLAIYTTQHVPRSGDWIWIADVAWEVALVEWQPNETGDFDFVLVRVHPAPERLN